ncbi:MAG TPA: hypothetical protein PLH23_12705 [Hyphomonadaceae bacterium]|jgi:hypothetical protein|nr:hypothetical protein [Hyphomonadaceae bacterium]
MKRILLATVALALGACASGPGTSAKTPAELILGKWNCKATAEGITTDADVTYLTGGKATMDAKVGVSQSGMAINILAKADASWNFLPDGKLEETITKMTVTKGTMGGNDVPPAMIQGMIEQAVVNQKTVSTAVFTDTSFTSTDESGTVTSCTR